MRSNILAYLILVLSITVAVTPAQDRPTVAVLDFQPLGISEIESAVVTSRLRTAIGEDQNLLLIERGAMEAILKEQDFQLSGCTSNECAVEVGQLLNATYMVAGTIGKLGSMFTIDARIVDIETGSIKGTLSRDHTGSIEGLIAEIRFLADDLSIKLVDSSSSRAPAHMVTLEEPSNLSSSIVAESAIIDNSLIEEISAAIDEKSASPLLQPASDYVRLDFEILEVLPKKALQFNPRQPTLSRGIFDILANLQYPESARQEGLEGRVTIACFVEESGYVIKAVVINSSDQEFTDAAIEAVKRTRFNPSTNMNDQPVAAWVVVLVPFRLG